MSKQECVFNFKTNEIIDLVCNDKLVYGNNKSVQDLLNSNPDLKQVGLTFAEYLKEASCVTLPKEIDEERFDYLFQCMPPVDVQFSLDSQTFKLVEKVTSNISLILAKVGSKYYELQDYHNLTHQQILERIANDKNYIEVSSEYGIFYLKTHNYLRYQSINFNYANCNHTTSKILTQLADLSVANMNIYLHSQILKPISRKDYSDCSFNLSQRNGEFSFIHQRNEDVGLTKKGNELLNVEFAKIYDSAIKPHLAYLLLRDKEESLNDMEAKLKSIQGYVTESLEYFAAHRKLINL